MRTRTGETQGETGDNNQKRQQEEVADREGRPGTFKVKQEIGQRLNVTKNTQREQKYQDKSRGIQKINKICFLKQQQKNCKTQNDGYKENTGKPKPTKVLDHDEDFLNG